MPHRRQNAPNSPRVTRQRQEHPLVVRKHVVEELGQAIPAGQARLPVVGFPEEVGLGKVRLEGYMREGG